MLRFSGERGYARQWLLPFGRVGGRRDEEALIGLSTAETRGSSVPVTLFVGDIEHTRGILWTYPLTTSETLGMKVFLGSACLAGDQPVIGFFDTTRRVKAGGDEFGGAFCPDPSTFFLSDFL